MKKVSYAILLLFFLIGHAKAEFVEEVTIVQMGPGGFVADQETISTVKQVNEMRNDVPVIVVGNLVQRMGDEKYLFEDSTGSMTVEIDDDAWRGQTVTPSDIVKLYGEVDRGIFKTEIDVDYVKKM